MYKITPQQFEQIRIVVKKYTDAIIASVAGVDVLTPDAYKAIKALNIDPPPKSPLVREMHDLGHIVAAISDPKARYEMTYDEYLRRLKERRTPLSQVEVRAVDYAAARSAEYVRGLGNTISAVTGHLLIEADDEQRRWKQGEIRTAVSDGVRWRRTVARIKQDIGRATGDWARDLHRIATTESNNAYQQGYGEQIAALHGNDARVIRSPNPDACDDCKRLFLGSDGKPKVFKLSEIEANSNVGQKRQNWQPTLESVHPWCGCQTHFIPQGWGFDEDGDLIPL